MRIYVLFWSLFILMDLSAQIYLTESLERTKNIEQAFYKLDVTKKNNSFIVQTYSVRSNKLLKIESFSDKKLNIKEGTSYYYDTITNRIIRQEDYSNNLLNGYLITFYKIAPTNQIEIRSQFKNGQKEGLEEVFYRNGKKASETIFLNNERVGISRSFSSNGNITTEITYKNNKVAIKKGYYEDGKLSYIEFFDEFGRTGKWLNYHPNGSIGLVRNYLNDVEVDTTTGYFEDSSIRYIRIFYPSGISTQKTFYKNHNIEFEGQYVQNSKEGKWTTYFEDGTISKYETYKNGKLTGEFWNKTSFGYEKGNYLNDRIIGEYVGYYSNNNMKFKINVDEVGNGYSYTLWYENGKIWETGRYVNNNKVGKWITYDSKGNSNVEYYQGGSGD